MNTPNQHVPWRAALVDRIRQQALPPEKFSHQARLYNLACEIASAETAFVDDDVLFAAAWTHDLGVFIGHRPSDIEQLKLWNSTAYTMTAAPQLLLACGFPEGRIAAVVECIRTHEAPGQPITDEGLIFRDADLLELIGAVAIMRTAAKIAQDTRFITFADAAASLRRALETVPGQVSLPQARALAMPRILMLREFLNALDTESQGILD